METIMQYIPLAVSAILLAALILTVITNIITQVVKKITWDKIPTNILAVVVAMAVTLVAFFAACQVMGWAVTWYMVAGAVALGLFVAYAAMFGFDKLREALETKRKEVKKECMAPYTDFEGKVKELVGLIDKPLSLIHI